MIARGEDARVLLCQKCTDRHTAGESLREGINVGFHSVVFERKPLAGSAQSRLNLVEYEQQALLITPIADAMKIIDSREVNAAFSLDHFEHDRAGLRASRRLQGV